MKRHYTPEQLESNRLWQRGREARRHANGLCINCDGQSPRFLRCLACRLRIRARRMGTLKKAA
jgi:hypothetical protein